MNSQQEQPTTNVNIPENVGTVNIEKRAIPEPIRLMYLRLFIPAFFSLLVMTTAIYKIVSDEQETPELRSTWWTILATQAAAWMPSPIKKPE